MPLNAKGRTIMQAMRQQYGNRAERVFYAARNAGTIAGVDRRSPVDGMPGRDGDRRSPVDGMPGRDGDRRSPVDGMPGRDGDQPAAAGGAATAAPPRRPVVRRRN